MKDFFINPLAGMMALLCLIVLFVMVAGCKSLPQETTARLAVSYATSKYIEKAGDQPAQVARAVRIVAVLDLVDGLAGGELVTIDYLRAYVAQRLPVDLSPADRVLAGVLIDVITQELKARVGEGVIPADQLVKVKAVFGWIREGASYYLPPSVET